MTVLLTGYEPFGDHDTNPSAQVARALDGATVGGHGVVGRVLPVVFDEARPEMERLIENHDPDAVVATGLMPERAALTVERVGINVRDYDGVPDNEGAEPVDDPVLAGGPDAYFATLPIRDLVAAMTEAGVPARVSNEAGTHLCNNILYATRDYVEREGLGVPVGFVHVPFSHEQVAAREEIAPSMSLDAMERGLRAAIAAL